MVLDFQNNDANRSLDVQQTLDWQAGWQVIDPAGGSNLVTAGSGDFEYDVAAGDINAGGTVVACTQQTVDFTNDVDASDDQLAVIYRDANGDAQKSIGPTGTRTPASDDVRSTHTPPPPTLHNTDAVVVAEVLLPAGASSVGATELRDRRAPEVEASLIATESVTLTGGATPADETTASGVATSETDGPGRATVTVASPTTHSQDYEFNTEARFRWNQSAGHWNATVTTAWDTDPGSGNDVSATLKVYEE